MLLFLYSIRNFKPELFYCNCSMFFTVCFIYIRICSKEEGYQKQRNQIISNMEKRGYKIRELENILRKVDNIDRVSLLKYKKGRSGTNERVPLVVTYTKKNTKYTDNSAL